MGKKAAPTASHSGQVMLRSISELPGCPIATRFEITASPLNLTKTEAERVGKYMIRPVLSLERLSFLEREGKVGYRWDQDRAEQEAMDYLEFIARITSHIPDKGQVTVRYYGLYANAHRGKIRKASVSPFVLRMAEDDLKPVPSKGLSAVRNDDGAGGPVSRQFPCS